MENKIVELKTIIKKKVDGISIIALDDEKYIIKIETENRLIQSIIKIVLTYNICYSKSRMYDKQGELVYISEDYEVLSENEISTIIEIIKLL